MTEEASVRRAILKVGGTTSSTVESVRENTDLPTSVFEASDNVRAANADVGGDQPSLDVRSPTRLLVRTEATPRTKGSGDKRAAADHPTLNYGAATRSARFARNWLEKGRGLSDQFDKMQNQVKRVSAEVLAPGATH